MAVVATTLLRTIPASGKFAIGLSGAPGCGKSTLARLLVELLTGRGDHAMVISLDDYYLGKHQRMLASETHPLFAQRGVPGTHDWRSLVSDIDHLKAGETELLQLPRFDKMRDDRISGQKSEEILTPPRVIILEGWLIGAPPQEPSDLEKPVNQLEIHRDSNNRWRQLVNTELTKYHHDLSTRLDALWFMSAPGWDHVIDWRWQQECEGMRSGQASYLETREAVSGFLSRFQRIAMHMRQTCTEWADIVIDIDQNHILKILQD